MPEGRELKNVIAPPSTLCRSRPARRRVHELQFEDMIGAVRWSRSMQSALINPLTCVPRQPQGHGIRLILHDAAGPRKGQRLQCVEHTRHKDGAFETKCIPLLRAALLNFLGGFCTIRQSPCGIDLHRTGQDATCVEHNVP